MAWIRAILVFGVLIGGGTVRWMWADQVKPGLSRLASPLSDLPMEAGPWIGRSVELDPIIARATGASDHIERAYRDSRTGAEIDVIVLFGLPESMFMHDPKVCYPAAGYEPSEGPAARPIRLGSGSGTSSDSDKAEIPFQTLVYTKGGERQEVYWSWRLNEAWMIDPGQLKEVQRVGGMIKVQIGRGASARERVGARMEPNENGNPCEDFLKHFLPELTKLARPVP